MPTDRWQLIKSLVDAALDMDPGERLQFLERSCPDAATRREVESLLEHEGEAFPDTIHVDAVGDAGGSSEVAAGSPTVAAAGPGVSGSPRDGGVGGQPRESGGAGVAEIGSRLGHFEFKGALGAGGMGEVYRALDTKLGREVAIKLLPEEMAHDPERLARLRREAQVLASLNHPGIASIYDLGEHEAQHYLVLELVEGETLAEQLARGPMPVPVALQVALQIAEALEAAHGAGVVHRDLKPSNVKITPEFKVVVLDFGLAKVTAPADGDSGPDLSMSPTVMDSATRAGVILGTAGYMSPEQARGRPVDRRSDVWGFGCLFYEMLTGRRTFEGTSVTDLLAAIVKDEPDWRALPPSLPPTAFALLRRCLQKSRSRRLHDIADARVELQEAIEEPEGIGLPGAVVTGSGLNRMLPVRRVLPMAATLALLAGAAGSWAAATEPPAPRAPVKARLSLTDAALARPNGSPVALSPDGSRIAYAEISGGTERIWVRRLDEEVGTRLGEGSVPFFSPDGQWVGWLRSHGIVRAPVGGGAPQQVVEALAPTERDLSPRGVAWSADGTMIYGTRSAGLQRVAEEGGEPEAITEATDELPALYPPSHRWPDVLPGGRHVLFTVRTGTGTFEDARIEVLDLATRERKIVLRGGTYARYVPTGHIVYLNRGVLYAAPFDVGTLELTGPAVSVIDGVAWWDANGGAYYAVSDSGTLVYVSGSQPTYGVVRVDRRGIRTPIDTIPPGNYFEPRLSPDGRKLALIDWADGDRDIRVYDLVRGGQQRLTTYPGLEMGPIWSPDGEYVAFTSERKLRGARYDIFMKRADGSGDVLPVTAEARRPPDRVDSFGSEFVHDWSPEGLVITQFRPGANVVVLPPGDDATPVVVAGEPEREEFPVISPDGRWIAYQWSRSGRREIYVRRYPPGPGAFPISTDGGAFARWSRDGRELFFRTDEGIMVVDVDPDAEPDTWGAPRYLFQGAFRGGVEGMTTPSRPCPCWSYDVAPDGQSFVMFPTTEDRPGDVMIVTDWFEELKRLVPIPE